MGISVGSVTVDIVPDTTNFRRDLNAKLKDLSAQVRAELDDRKFKAELDEATRDRKVDVKVDEKGSLAKAQGNSHALLTTLGLLAPAAAPLTAVAIGATAALGGLGAAGLLAFKGIQAEMAAATPVGKQYSRVVQTIKGDLALLEKAAAGGVLAGLTHSAELVHGSLPELEKDVTSLATSLGSDLAPVTDGLLSLFKDLQPEIGSVSDGIHSLAVDFQTWADGPGGVRFANYLATELPIVAHALGALVGAGEHLVTALLPLGGPVLKAITGVSDAISHIPVSVIQDLFTAFAAYKTITLTGAAIDGVTAAVKRLAAAQAATGGLGKGSAAGLGARAVGLAGGIPAVAAAGIGLGALGAQVITAHGQKLDNSAAQGIVNSGVGGFNAAVAQNTTNVAQLNALKTQQAQLFKSGQSSQALAMQGDIDRLSTSTINLGKALSIAKPLIASTAANNKMLGLTADGTKDALTGETTAMSALITTSDKLASAAQGVAGANINAHQAILDANTSLKDNGKTLDQNTQKGLNNRTALLNVAAALRAKIDADAANGAGTKKVNDDTKTSIDQLQTMAHKFGLSKAAAHDYAVTLLGIPKNVLTTVTVNGISKSAAQIAALKKQEGALQFYANQKQATGGFIRGAGTGTSDSIPALLSNGEFVVNAKATAKNAALLHKINSSTPAFAGGGLVGFASGGLVDANLSGISSILNNPVTTAAQVASARTAEARATATLAGAEAVLQHLRAQKHPDAAAIHAEEKRITADRLALAAATTKLAGAQKSYAAGRSSLATKFATAAGLTARTDAGFLANLNKISSRGFGFLAQELLAEGDADAMQVAAEFVGWSNSKLSAVQKSLLADSATQAGLQSFGTPAAAAAPVQVTQNITAPPGMSPTALGNIAAGQVAMALAR